MENKLKKTSYLLLIVTISLFSCNKEIEENNIADNLIGVRWENADLNFIELDSTSLLMPIKDMYPMTKYFEYSIKSDTLRIINKAGNTYNLIDFKDTISYIRILPLENDSIKLELLNDGAKELFEGFENFTFYNSNTIDRFSYYQEKNPLCFDQINKAKEEIKSDSLVLCIHPRWPFRQEKEFIGLLKNHGIKYKNLGVPPDVFPADRDCYRETMDYYIQKRFGQSFVDSLMKEADILMVHHNRSEFIEYYACDERPHRPNSKPGYDNSLTAKVDLPVREFRKEWKTSKGEDVFAIYRPFMDIGFHIDTTGVISNFYLNNFNPELDWNRKYKDNLFKLGVEKIQEDSIWVPGKILGIMVRTDNNVRIHFERESE